MPAAGASHVALALIALASCTHGAPATGDAGTGASTATGADGVGEPSTRPPDVPPPSASALLAAPPLSPRRAAALADDLRARLAAARAALHPPPRVRAVGGAIVLAAADRGIPLDRAADIADQTQTALFDGRLQHRADRAVTVFVFSSRDDYARTVGERAAGAPPDAFGLYDPVTREAFVCTQGASVDATAHELTHAFLHDDFPRAPRWLDEGVASLFELPDFSTPGQIHGKAHFRLQTLRAALARPATAPLVLDALFAMTPESLDGRRDPLAYLHYAMAREAMRWLDSRGKLWSFYGVFRDGVLTDPTGVEAFARVAGKSPSDATPDWLAWIRSVASESP